MKNNEPITISILREELSKQEKKFERHIDALDGDFEKRQVIMAESILGVKEKVENIERNVRFIKEDVDFIKIDLAGLKLRI